MDTVLRYIINIVLLITGLIIVITGLMKFPGLLGWLGVDSSVMPWKDISFWHDWAGIIFAVLVIIHILIHLRWYVTTTMGFFRKKEEE